MFGSPSLLHENVVRCYHHGAATPCRCRYTKLPASALPPLFLAYAADPSDSGRIHAPVKQRWLAGDKEVRTHDASLHG